MSAKQSSSGSGSSSTTNYYTLTVNELSQELGVSQVTIRKDLNYLSSSGIILREHDYALKKDAADIRNRISINYSLKVKIAHEASNLVEDSETVMIGSGSTCALLAEELVKTKPNVTIITHSTYIAEHVSRVRNSKVILLGGVYQTNSQANVGSLVGLCAREFYVDKIFLGTDGFEKDVGFMGSDMLRSEAIETMSESAKHIIMMTDSSKLNKKGTIVQFKQYDISTLITDSDIPSDLVDYFKRYRVEVIMIKKEQDN